MRVLDDVESFMLYSNGPDKPNKLNIAIRQGNKGKVVELLDAGANINEQDNEDCTPLCIAARCESLEIVQLLLARGASVDLAFKNGMSPLHAASQCGNLEAVKLLLDHGADVNLGTTNNLRGTTALIGAAQEGCLEVVKLLVERGARVDLASKSGTTPLLIATQREFYEVVEFLLDKGANANCRNKTKITPLYLACSRCNLKLVELLLDRGAKASINLRVRDGYSPLGYAVNFNNVEIAKTLLAAGAKVDAEDLSTAIENRQMDLVKVILENGGNVLLVKTFGGKRALLFAAQDGHLELVKQLLAAGIPVDFHEGDGVTSLILAAQNGHLEVVELLLEHGASLHAVTKAEDTALTSASRQGHLVVVKLLLERGARVNYKTRKGCTPLHLATNGGHIEIVRLLLDNGASIDATQNSYTALCLAAKKGHMEVARLLLERGANVDWKSDKGTPIGIAALDGHMAIAKILIQRGATQGLEDVLPMAAHTEDLEVVHLLLDIGVDVNSVSKKGYTALNAAAFKGNVGLVKLLLDRGASVDCKDNTKEGCTALIAACHKGHLAVAKLLLDRGASVDATRNNYYTPICEAVEQGYLDLVEVLVEQGAKVDWISSTGHSLLFLAGKHKHFEVMQLLVSLGAPLDEPAATHTLRKTLKDGQLDVAEFIIRNRPQAAVEVQDAVCLAVESSHSKSYEIVNMLIASGADLNTKIKNKFTALHLAVMKKNTEMVWKLVLHGADITVPYTTSAATQTVWQLCQDNNALHEALLHYWTPQTHQRHPYWVRQAIVCTLSVSKRLSWPFDRPLMHKILSHVAYGWVYCGPGGGSREN